MCINQHLYRTECVIRASPVGLLYEASKNTPVKLLIVRTAKSLLFDNNTKYWGHCQPLIPGPPGLRVKRRGAKCRPREFFSCRAIGYPVVVAQPPANGMT